MDIIAIFLTVAVLALVVIYLSAPFRRGKGWRIGAEEHELSALLAEHERTLDSLQELDFDFRLGKIPEGEYPSQRANLLQKGADLLRQIDALHASHPHEAAKDTLDDAQIETLISKRRAELKNQLAGFCPHCGKPAQANDKFCSSCGKALNHPDD
ncbi:MAG: zinc ribbon domain-containing protein [Anaerolineales bacterium]|nr:zinc ribbon domain-containing protein [Anaerolineales bacterium]